MRLRFLLYRQSLHQCADTHPPPRSFQRRDAPGETLAEAGLYFAGKTSWANTSGQKDPGYPGTGNDFGSSGVYTSPIEWRCQKNYIIVITDGMPQDDTGDGNGENIFTRANYINNKSIGRYYGSAPRDIDKDGDCTAAFPNSCEHFLDDTAKFLYDVDLIDTNDNDNANGGSFNDTGFPPQRITTYTIGFGSECDKTFLDRVSDDNHGHGKTLMATDSETLSDALVGILGEIMKANGNFVTPVVPVSKLNQVYSGNSLYISLFRTDSSAFWMGNLKKFGYSKDGKMLDRFGIPADLSETAEPKPSSCWGSSISDGLEVDLGGAGRQVNEQTLRKFFTYYNNETSPNPTSLTNGANAFSVDNDLLTNEVLGIDGATQTRDDLIHFVRADGSYSGARDWVLGDMMHSRSSVMRDGNKNYIFVGANDGFLHCFEDDEKDKYEDLNEDTISEKWCFIPWHLLNKLTLMKNTKTHQYFVDGSPVLYSLDGYKYLTFGLRRGGSNYYTLKVGRKENNEWRYMDPVWAWEIDKDDTSFSFLGESWCDPRFCKLKSGSGSVSALILAGGYDSDSQDLETPPDEDTKGCGIYAVNAGNGTLLSSVLHLTKSSPSLSSMTRCIVDLVAFDSNNDGFTDKIYAGDMGGQIFAMKGPASGSAWTGRKLFQAGDGTSKTSQMKFFCAPDVAIQGYQYMDGTNNLYTVNDYVYAGTGDREHPLDIVFENRFYAIKNRDDATVLTENSLTDVTFYSNGYSSGHDASFLRSMNSRGWFIRLGYELGSLERKGEKVVSSPSCSTGSCTLPPIRRKHLLQQETNARNRE
jgi:type IV pilus assembly protein PilY1